MTARICPPGRRPLDGVRVIDAAGYVTGPFAAMMLADLGADVVKVEPPTGDPNRRFGYRPEGAGATTLFANTNRGKRSAALDLKVEPDLAVFRSLVCDADVLVENWRPGVAERLGIGRDTLAELNPRLVHLAITGYGPDGPDAGRGAFDASVQAAAGVAWANARQGRPELLRFYLVDKVTAAFAVQGVLASLLRRTTTGRGELVEVSMLDSAAYFDFPELFARRTVLSDAGAVDPEDNPGVHTLVPTSDGFIVVAPSQWSHVVAAAEACGHPEWPAEVAGLRGFGALAPALMQRIGRCTATGTTAEWVDRFTAADVPVAAVRDLDGHLDDPQVRNNGTYVELESDLLGRHRAPCHPVRVGGERLVAIAPAPALDEHGVSVRVAMEENVR